MMFCATLLVAGQCAFTCGGDLDEFRKAWNIRWDNGAQAVVDNYGPVAPLRRVNGEVVWAVEAEPASCTPVPKLKPTRCVEVGEPGCGVELPSSRASASSPGER
jgi:hypothetical protein